MAMTFSVDGRLDATVMAQFEAAGISYGLSIGRRAPLHKMHLDCILEIASAGLTPVIVVGSTNAAGDAFYDPLRNPLTIEAQMAQLRHALPPEVLARCKVLTLPDEVDDATWFASLQKLLAENGMAGKTVMHFRAKAADAAPAEAGVCKPLSHYKQSLVAQGIAVWQSYNSDPADDHINASDLRKLDLSLISQEHFALAPALGYLVEQASCARADNPDGASLTAAGIPLSMLDFTLDRLYREAGVRTCDLLAQAALTAHVGFTALTEVVREAIARLKRKPMIAAAQYPQAFIGHHDFDILPVSLGTYQSGEGYCELFSGDDENFEVNAERIKGAHVYVVHSTATPVGDNVQHLLHMVHTLKAQGAEKVTVVMPFAAYARQDRAFARRFMAVGAELLPCQLKAAGADAVLSVTLHSQKAIAFYQASFGQNFVHISTAALLAGHLQKMGLTTQTAVIGAPDGGEKLHDEGIARARDVGKSLCRSFNDAAMFRISKVHTAVSDTKVTAFSGDVRDKTAVVIDDMVDGGSTLINAARVLKDNGASAVICCVTHGVLSADARPALEKLLSAEVNGKWLIDRFVVTDSIPDVAAKVAALPPELAARVDILTLAPVLAEHIQTRHHQRFYRKATP